MPRSELKYHFKDLAGFDERHSHTRREECATALFYVHRDLKHYDCCRDDLAAKRNGRYGRRHR